MCRGVALLVLIGLMTGCMTRYGSNPSGGPFARRPSAVSDGSTAVPVPNNSPLILTASNQTGPVATTENQIVPPRPSEQTRFAANDSVPPASIPIRTVDDDDAGPAGRGRTGGDGGTSQIPAPSMPKGFSGITTAGGTTGSTQPGPSLAARNIAEVKKLALFAAEKWAKVDTYEAIVTRREVTPNKEKNEDVVLYQFRKEPMSVYMKNLSDSGKGREVLYTRQTDKMYVILGEGDNKIFKSGFRAPPMSPDDPRVKEKSRYSIREAGYGTPIAKLLNWVAKAEAGKIPADALTVLGPVERKEYPYPLIGVSLKLRPGDEATMPNGGTRQWFFDTKADSTSFGWPVLIAAYEPGGNESEYYLFEKVKLQVRFTDADFSPERLGKK